MKKSKSKRYKMYKYLATIMLLVSSASAAELSVLTGSYTYHLSNADGSAKYYAHRKGASGRLIRNPILGFRLQKNRSKLHTKYQAVTIFGGQDSIGSPIWGSTYHHGLFKARFFEIGAVAGGYVFNQEKWDSYGEELHIDSPISGVMPVGGVELNVIIPVSKKFKLRINNTVTPLITTTVFGIAINF
jgi:hypothetical protein